jgi:hypothetical protein
MHNVKTGPKNTSKLLDGASLTSSFLAKSATFLHTSTYRPTHVLLNLHEIAHPHTGNMLAEKLNETPDQWSISIFKVLMVVTDNGSNMTKAVPVVREVMRESYRKTNAICG